MNLIKYVFISLIVCCFNVSYADDFVIADDAADYVGNLVVVCGKVVEVHTTRKHVFVNFEKKYPDQPFHVYINKPEKYIDMNTTINKNICVKGTVMLFNDRPEIKNPSSLKVMD